MKHNTARLSARCRAGLVILCAGSAALLLLLAAARAQTRPRLAQSPASQPGVSLAQPNFAVSRADAKLSPPDQLRRFQRQLPLLTAPDTNESWCVLFLEFADEAARARLRLPGYRGQVGVFNSFQRFANVFVKYDTDFNANLDALAATPGLMQMELASSALYGPPPNPAFGGDSKGSATYFTRQDYQGLTGRGVTIVLVDSGLDFRNPDFITEKGQSRLSYFWDTTRAAPASRSRPPVSFPDGTPLGTLYTNAELNAELRQPRGLLPNPDTNGHGTAAAGVAAGNGRNANSNRDKVMGVATEADLIAVKIGDQVPSNGFLLNAVVGWLDQTLQGRPFVVSCSFGANIGGRDGQLIEERQLSARFADDTRGRALVAAAGNERDKPLHQAVSFRRREAAGQARLTEYGVSAKVYAYFDSGNVADLWCAPLAGGEIKKYTAHVNPFTGQAVAVITFDGAGLEFYTASGQPVKADLFIGDNTYSFAGSDRQMLITTPGSTRQAITVGSYDFDNNFQIARRAGAKPVSTAYCGFSGSKSNVKGCPPFFSGQLSFYSSLGPLRGSVVSRDNTIEEGPVKPDLVAPGQYFLTSRANDTCALQKENGANCWLVDPTNRYVLFNGTSAATPYTAGVIALLFQKHPSLSVGGLKDLLSKDPGKGGDNLSGAGNGSLPNVQWGNGRLDSNAISNLLEASDKIGR